LIHQTPLEKVIDILYAAIFWLKESNAQLRVLKIGLGSENPLIYPKTFFTNCFSYRPLSNNFEAPLENDALTVMSRN